MRLISLLALLAGLGYSSAVLALTGVQITAATGGGAISANTNGATGSGVYTTLTGPVLEELNPGGVASTGTIILTVPAGFEFDTGTNVTATVTAAPGKNCTAASGLLVGSSPGAFTQTVTPTATTITINVFRKSSPPNQCVITYTNINVRPTTGILPASGNITRSGTASITENPVTTNYGTLTVAAGTATKLAFVQQPSNTVAGATISPAVTVAIQDAAGNPLTSNTNTVTLAIGTNPGGGTLSGTLSVAAIAGVATFSTLSINLVGTGYTLTASASGLTGATSSAFNVTTGAVSATVSTVTASPTSVAADGVTTSTITVTLTDASGNPVSGKTVTLAAGSGSSTITTVSGITNASGQATFTVKDSVVEAVTYTATDTTDSITITQTATVTFAAVVSSFNAVEPGANAVTGKIFTKIAGQNFALDIVALDASNAIATGFTGTVAVEVVDNSGGGACSGLPLIGAFTNQIFIVGDAGRHPLSSPNAVANVYPNARIRIKYPVASPTVISCSGDNFAIRPSSLASASVTDLDAQTAGTTRTLANTGASGGNVHRAGQPFTLRATAVNSAAATTTNYTGTPSVILSACAGTACTAPVTFGTFSIGAGAAVAGVINSTTATYSEVGSFSLQLQDQTFANVDIGDGTPADCSASGRYVCSAAFDVGRFVPDHFDTVVTGGMTCPTGLTCPLLFNGFVYSGQTFTTNVIARNLAGVTTLNYAGALAKTVTLSAWDNLGSTATQNPPAATPGALSGNVVAAAAFTNGATTLGTPATPIYTLPNAYPSVTPPPGPTDIYLRADDSENITSLRGVSSVEGGIKVISGRMKISSAHGSELLRLPIGVIVQYWNGTNYVTSTTDSVTTFANASVLFANWQPLSAISTWVAGSTSVAPLPASVAFTNGVGSFRLSAPGAGKTGSVDMTTNAPTYLPSTTGRATFGVYKSGNEFIYLRENY